jgi:hypothetical protein
MNVTDEVHRDFGPDDDYPHPVPPQAFQIWRENWVFPSVDPVNKVACLFHFSLRPGQGEGIFTAKFAIDGWEHRYVGRSPVPRDLSTFRPVKNEKITFTVVKPAQEFHLEYRSDELDADITYTARFPAWDFKRPIAPEQSILGDVGRTVFPFHHMEQSLFHEGVIKVKAGPKDGSEIHISGFANRDHSWGWRDDLTFNHHHWLCASFDDRFLEGAKMQEDYYPHGPKVGGWFSTAAGNSAVLEIDSSDAYWLDVANEPLPDLDRDVRYRLTTEDGQVATIIAHIASSEYGRLYLDARSKDHTKVYQDVQMFCDFTIEETGQKGYGVLEIGKQLVGEGMAERAMRSASRV